MDEPSEDIEVIEPWERSGPLVWIKDGLLFVLFVIPMAFLLASLLGAALVWLFGDFLGFGQVLLDEPLEPGSGSEAEGLPLMGTYALYSVALGIGLLLAFFAWWIWEFSDAADRVRDLFSFPVSRRKLKEDLRSSDRFREQHRNSLDTQQKKIEYLEGRLEKAHSDHEFFYGYEVLSRAASSGREYMTRVNDDGNLVVTYFDHDE